MSNMKDWYMKTIMHQVLHNIAHFHIEKSDCLGLKKLLNNLKTRLSWLEQLFNTIECAHNVRSK